jgi:uncharacterized protein YyaL (SSP411 family)
VNPTNRLARESSLYLRQHAHNPIDWYPWGPEALQKAKDLDRPIFLSIGYSACHWCHVMAHESFEDQRIAEILNQYFVSIKVDREERPDLDAVYMAAVQALNQGQGGWPMSVFLTPDLEPFYAGTYFPPDHRYGRPGFGYLLTKIVEAWQTRREELRESGRHIAQALRESMVVPPQPGEPDATLFDAAAQMFRRAFDPVSGGLGRAPKFPRPIDLRLMLRLHQRGQSGDLLGMVRLTLDKMAQGGIYDHLGGGFHRYSTDERWLVPHFEKMLYDNALLPPAYVEAYQLTRDPLYKQVASETLDWVLREMTSPAGAFYSTLDADSDGEEGKFYVWSEEEIDLILGPELSETFKYVYDVSAPGNWEGHNILNRPKTWEQLSPLLKRSSEELQEQMALARQRLLLERAKRIWPGRDEKILTSWNALMVSAMAQAGAVFDEPRFLQAAQRAADFILTHLQASAGRLWHTSDAQGNAKQPAYLDDYAYLIETLITLYEADFQPRWLSQAIRLAEVMIEQFGDPVDAGFFYTARDHESLLVRTKEIHDSSTPSSMGSAVLGLLRLSALTGRHDFRESAERTLRAYHGAMAEAPLACGTLLLGVDFWLGPVEEVAIIGRLHDRETRQVLRALRGQFRPLSVMALRDPSVGEDAGIEAVGLLRGKEALGPVTTYLCRNFACQSPLVGAAALEQALRI